MVVAGTSRARTEKYSISRMSSSNQRRSTIRQPVELEDPRSTPDPKRYSEPPALGHRCVLCRKLRSTAYQRDHPIAPGEEPIPGVCSRPACSARKRAWDASKKPSQVMVVEMHCYIYNYDCPDQSTDAPLTVELPGEEKGWRKELPHGDYWKSTWTQKTPSAFNDMPKAPPRVTPMTKPTFIPR